MWRAGLDGGRAVDAIGWCGPEYNSIDGINYTEVDYIHTHIHTVLTYLHRPIWSLTYELLIKQDSLWKRLY